MNPTQDTCLQLKITLLFVIPLVWRRILVPRTYTFWDLHVAIQDSMGWKHAHLHEFEVLDQSSQPRDRIGIPEHQLSSRSDIRPSWLVPVSTVLTSRATQIRYLYDFGDNWEHTIEFEKEPACESSTPLPACISGQRMCPPEDCGGPPGFQHLIEVMGDPEHADHQMMLDWISEPFDRDAFDAKAVVFSDPQERLRALQEG